MADNQSWNIAVDSASPQPPRQPRRRGTWRTNAPAPRSPNSVTTKHFTGIKRAPPKTSKASASSAFFFPEWALAQHRIRESFARRIELAANTPPKTGRIVHFSSTASAAQPLWCLSEEHPDRPTRAPGGPCDLNLFLSSTTK